MSGILAGVRRPDAWSTAPLGRIAPRHQEIGQPNLPPLSVFLTEGVVPRSSRSDNHNQLGADLGRYLVVRPGDLVVNKLRAWQGGLGVAQDHGIVSPAYFVCRPDETVVLSRFLHYATRSEPYLQEITRISKWMPPSQFDVAWEDLRDLTVMYPSPQAQKAVADFLDAETARIDALIDKKRRLIVLLEERELSYLSELAVPKRAEFSRLGRLAFVRSGITVDAGRRGPLVRPYLRVANVQHGSLDLSEIKEITVSPADAANYALRYGDVLMTEGGDLDKLGRGTVWRGEVPGCLHQNHVFAVHPNTRVLDSEYLEILSATAHARAYFERTGARTTNLASTNASKVAALPVPVLSLGEQRRIVECCREMRSGLRRTSETLHRQIQIIQEHRQALITAAVTGEMRVPA